MTAPLLETVLLKRGEPLGFKYDSMKLNESDIFSEKRVKFWADVSCRADAAWYIETKYTQDDEDEIAPDDDFEFEEENP